MNTYYNKLVQNLEILKLNQIKLNISQYLDLITDGKKDIVEGLYDLTCLEIKLKEDNAMNAFVKVANFPFIKTLDDYDFSFQPSINKDKIMGFKTLRFLENKENIIFVGTPGVGKTHLATSIGIEAAKNRQITYFINANDLALQLKRAHIENRLDSKLKQLCKYKLLIIDELGFLPLDKESANLLFQLINRMYEKHSIIITTNKPLSKWGEVFGDNVIANAILDRLLHHSHIIQINGRSYRIKDVLEQLEKEESD